FARALSGTNALYTVNLDGSNLWQIASSPSTIDLAYPTGQPLLSICSHPSGGLDCSPPQIEAPGTASVSRAGAATSSATYRRQGYVVSNQAAYERAKREAAQKVS